MLDDEQPVLPGSAAAGATPPLQGGDRVVQIGDVRVKDHADVVRQFALHRDDVLRITVERATSKSGPSEVSSSSSGKADALTAQAGR